MALSKKKWIFIIFLGLCFLGIIFLITTATLALFSEKYPYKSAKPNSIAVLKIEGIIDESETFLRQLEDIKENEDIKAIIVRINSPGGVVAPAQEIHRELIRLKENHNKFVVASMETVAASGGYYVASAADVIVANPGTLTGSIGVKMEFANLEKFFEWAKIKPYSLTSGKYKDTGSFAREMTSSEKKLLEEMIHNVHEQFQNAILECRKTKITPKQLSEIADGRILTGEQALKVGLVDLLGNFEDAVLQAKNLAGIKEKPNIIWPRAKKHSLLRLFIEETMSVYFKPIPKWIF